VYDALLSAGAPEDKARAAAEVLANYESRFAGIDQQLADIRGVLRLHSWMLGFNRAFTLAILWKVFAA
jgi:hypothetical protein